MSHFAFTVTRSPKPGPARAERCMHCMPSTEGPVTALLRPPWWDASFAKFNLPYLSRVVPDTTWQMPSSAPMVGGHNHGPCCWGLPWVWVQAQGRQAMTFYNHPLIRSCVSPPYLHLPCAYPSLGGPWLPYHRHFRSLVLPYPSVNTIPSGSCYKVWGGPNGMYGAGCWWLATPPPPPKPFSLLAAPYYRCSMTFCRLTGRFRLWHKRNPFV